MFGAKLFPSLQVCFISQEFVFPDETDTAPDTTSTIQIDVNQPETVDSPKHTPRGKEQQEKVATPARYFPLLLESHKPNHVGC